MDITGTPTNLQPQAPPSDRDERSPRNATAQPPLTSGFGGVMDHERDLQRSTEAHLRQTHGVHATSLHGMLREQSAQLSDNLALLKQRYEALPHLRRLRIFRGRVAQEGPGAPVPRIDQLHPLIVKHRDTLADIAAQIGQRADGQRGELSPKSPGATSHGGSVDCPRPARCRRARHPACAVMGDYEPIGPGSR